jgi:hypothetical protein
MVTNKQPHPAQFAEAIAASPVSAMATSLVLFVFLLVVLLVLRSTSTGLGE